MTSTVTLPFFRETLFNQERSGKQGVVTL